MNQGRQWRQFWQLATQTHSGLAVELLQPLMPWMDRKTAAHTRLKCLWRTSRMRFVVGGKVFCLTGGAWLWHSMEGTLSMACGRNTMWLGQMFVMRRARVAESLA